jgi:hypothetical protein
VRVEWSYTKDKRELKRLYLSILPTIREVARAAGYAVGVHGSLTRDLDLIAAPWAEKCVAPEVLARRIELAVCRYPRRERYHWKKVRENAAQKPHGRLAFSIYLGTYAYIDLSVLPTQGCFDG